MLLIISGVIGKEEIATRAGTRALSLLAAPLHVAILQALGEGSKALLDLRRTVGSPPQTTMRGHLRTLAEIGVLERHRQNDFPGGLDLELTASGRELLGVSGLLRAWLAGAPEGPLELGTPAAKSAIKALAEGWSTTIVRALAARPLSLTQLDSVIELNYPQIERRLAAMRLAGQIEAMPGHRQGRPYVVTDWLRRAIAPLGAAARWERASAAAGAAPITRLDTEAAFLLTVPLLSPPRELSGACRLAVELPNGSNGRRLAGVLARVEGGRASCATSLQGHADAWASGSLPAWLRAVIEHDPGWLEIGGDYGLADALVDGLHRALFGARLR